MKTVLSIAGSDSGGCAGIQADIKTISALGCFATTAITAITAQNTLGVQQVAAVKPAMISAQINSVLADIGADAIKIGMLADTESILAVAETLRAYPGITIVHDPVMVATSGDVLMPQDCITAMRQQLLPLATIITPNYAEACLLAGKTVNCGDSPDAIALILRTITPAAVLITGGDSHDSSRGYDEMVTDHLYLNDTKMVFMAPRIITSNTHGTGCTMASAITCYLARGMSVVEAVKSAKDYISQAIALGAQEKIGNGCGPVAHFIN